MNIEAFANKGEVFVRVQMSSGKCFEEKGKLYYFPCPESGGRVVNEFEALADVLAKLSGQVRRTNPILRGEND